MMESPDKLPRRRKKKKRKKKKQPQLSKFQLFVGAIRDLWSEYELIAKPLIAAVVVGVTAFTLLTLYHRGSLFGRHYTEYSNRTIPKWLELEREGKARRAEVLWRDQKWTPLIYVLELDWEAVPELLQALADDRTRRLAEEILELHPRQEGSPRTADILAGFEMERQDQKLWAIRLASHVDSGTEQVIARLEEFASGLDEELKAAATKSLEALEGG